MAEVRTGSALEVASQRLQQKKENLIEQLKCAEEYVNGVSQKRNHLISKLDEECQSLASEFEVAKNALEERKHSIIEELKMKTQEKLNVMTASIEAVNAFLTKATVVSV